MKRKHQIFIIMTIILSVSYLDLRYMQVIGNMDLFQDILKRTDGSVIEYGVKASYVTKKSGEETCLQILKKLNIKDCINTKIKKDEHQYCIEFSDDYKSGYIRSVKNKGFNEITINIIEIKSSNNLKELKGNIIYAIDNNGENIEYYQYLKAKTLDSDISNINEEIVRTLKSFNSQEINTVEISNGYSTVANTGCFKPIKCNGKDIDFNYAVCNYKSGSYIILGTPEIITSY